MTEENAPALGHRNFCSPEERHPGERGGGAVAGDVPVAQPKKIGLEKKESGAEEKLCKKVIEAAVRRQLYDGLTSLKVNVAQAFWSLKSQIEAEATHSSNKKTRSVHAKKTNHQNKL